MNEYTQRVIKIVAGIVGVLACLGLIIWGHGIGAFGNLIQGLLGLGLELLGLAGLIALLWLYNRQYK